MRRFSTFNLLAITLLALACVVIQAQAPATSLKPAHNNVVTPLNISAPIGCEKACLWYSGNNDPTSSAWNAVWNSNVPEIGVEAQIWVPFIPSYGPFAANASKITSITFNEYSLNAPEVTAMTFSFNTGMSSGNGGTVIYSGNCNFSSPLATGRTNGDFTEYAYTCVLPQSTTLLAGYEYWVNITPTITGDNPAYVSNTLSPYPQESGWGDMTNASYIYSVEFGGLDYLNTTTQGNGLEELSVGITGQYVKIY